MSSTESLCAIETRRSLIHRGSGCDVFLWWTDVAAEHREPDSNYFENLFGRVGKDQSFSQWHGCSYWPWLRCTTSGRGFSGFENELWTSQSLIQGADGAGYSPSRVLKGILLVGRPGRLSLNETITCLAHLCELYLQILSVLWLPLSVILAAGDTEGAENVV